eukprot:11452012-Alexandrium_andersonii.AAC.1
MGIAWRGVALRGRARGPRRARACAVRVCASGCADGACVAWGLACQVWCGLRLLGAGHSVCLLYTSDAADDM